MQNRNTFDMEINFTDTYIQYKGEHTAIREAACLKAQFPAILSDLQENDLFAGRFSYGAVGFSPHNIGFGYFFIKSMFLDELKKENIDEKYRNKLISVMEFWEKENTKSKVRSRYPEDMKKSFPSDDWENERGIAFPLYRMAGAYLNYQKLLTLGLPGLMKEIKNHKAIAEKQNGDVKLYEGMLMALDLLAEVCVHYSNIAKEQMAASLSQERKKELYEISVALQNIATNKPESFREAIQLFWIYSVITGTQDYGRMDVYLGDFYAQDIDNGIISEEQALQLLKSLWKLMADRKTIYDGRVIVGGFGRPNEKNADRFALLAMEATRVVKEIEPQLTLRFYKGMDPNLMEKALTVIGEGRTFPILYNDDVNVPAVQKAFVVSREEAEQYLPFGCGEYVLDHLSFGTPSGIINLLKALEITLHNGMDPETGEKIGLSLGNPKEFDTFDHLFCAYKRQVEHFVQLLADQEELEYKVAGEIAPFLYLSMLYDDCLEGGKSIFCGGVKYLGGTLETYGNTSTADSLTAIKELVYDKKRLSLEELLLALDSNFDGYEQYRRELMKCPKYGNDDEIADRMAIEVHNHICNVTRNQKSRTGLHSYLIVIINNHANTILGKLTAASADGRKSGESMSNGNAPSVGNDKNGVTALFNSLVKLTPVIHAGAVQNMKFSKELFTKNREKLKALLETYFDKGGAQAMITVVSRDELEKAQKEPEKYSYIFVRVGGFSARFIDLPPEEQQEIICRTLY